MPVTINGDGSITGLTAGGLPSTALTGTIPASTMPVGSVIQRAKAERISDVSRNSNGGWDDINSVSFTPLFSNSIINMSMNYSVGAQANADVKFRFAYQPSGGSDTEIEQTGIHRQSHSGQDALSTRFAWSHQYVQGNTTAYTYKLQGYKVGGGSAVVWYHTYGAGATSIFEITEIKQ